MKNRVIVLLASLVLVVGLGAPAFAGVVPTCDAQIEINALRGGSPTVSSNVPKDITSKARIVKGTAPADATIDNTTLTITVYYKGNPVAVETADGLTLVVGKGGTGAKLSVTLPVLCTPGDPIEYVSDFVGFYSENGATCSATSDPLVKTCK